MHCQTNKISCLPNDLLNVFDNVSTVGLYASQMMENRNAKRDAILIHYMRNHPDDFPETGM